MKHKKKQLSFTFLLEELSIIVCKSYIFSPCNEYYLLEILILKKDTFLKIGEPWHWIYAAMGHTWPICHAEKATLYDLDCNRVYLAVF